MIEWLNLTDDERKVSLSQANAKSQLPVKAIEKDWWVTLVLKAIFQSKYADHLLFKGGTSLSKCWNLIERFSEDIDLSIERDFFGFPEDLSKSQVKKLKRVAAAFTSNELKTELEAQLLMLGVAPDKFTIEADPIPDQMKDTDPQTLRIKYISLFDPVSYLADSVKLEVSARSLKEAGESKTINSILGEYMPGFDWSGESFQVNAVLPERTFLEKVFLLHEEFLRPAEQINFNRMSRHLYDIERMMDSSYGIKAISSIDYYMSIVKHRRNFIFKRGVDYNTHHPDTISFLPPKQVIEEYAQDYQQMREQMIYGESIEFSEIIHRLSSLKNKINKLK